MGLGSSLLRSSYPNVRWLECWTLFLEGKDRRRDKHIGGFVLSAGFFFFFLIIIMVDLLEFWVVVKDGGGATANGDQRISLYI